MNRSSFNQFYSLLRKHVGLSLDERKDYLVQSRLQPIAIKYKYGSVDLLIEQLLKEPVGLKHWESFVALTTNETYFFRDFHFFQGIRDCLFPKLIRALSTKMSINIWSAASSTGQEAYSIALLIRDSFPELFHWDIKIYGTDISLNNISRAKLGLYNRFEAERGLTEKMLDSYFVKHVDGCYEIKESIKSMVKFSKLNLLEAWSDMPRFDLILLRNVMIYFDKETRDHLLKRVSKQLNPSGGLVLGATETIISNQYFDLNQHERFAYFTPKISQGHNIF